MDAAKSDFGSVPPVSSIVDHITETATEIDISRERDGQSLAIAIPLDGSARDNDILSVQMKTTGHWEGGELLVDFSGMKFRRDVSYHERWTLGPGGNTLKVARHLRSPKGETDQTLIFLKQ